LSQVKQCKLLVLTFVCILFFHCLHTKNTIRTRSYSHQIVTVVTR